MIFRYLVESWTNLQFRATVLGAIGLGFAFFITPPLVSAKVWMAPVLGFAVPVVCFGLALRWYAQSIELTNHE